MAFGCAGAAGASKRAIAIEQSCVTLPSSARMQTSWQLLLTKRAGGLRLRVLLGRQGAILRAVATAWRWRGDGQRPDSDSSAHALALQAIAAMCRKQAVFCLLILSGKLVVTASLSRSNIATLASLIGFSQQAE